MDSGKGTGKNSLTSFRNVRKRNFTAVNNDTVNNSNISLEAKGLLLVFLSNSESWKIQMSNIIKRSKNGRDAHYRALDELIEHGYVARVEIRTKNGKYEKIEYIFSDEPEDVEKELEQMKIWASQNNRILVITYRVKKKKGKASKAKAKPFPENQETEFHPFPENPDTDKPNTEKPDSENQDIKNYNRENTNIENINDKNTNLEIEEEDKEVNPFVIDFLKNDLRYDEYIVNDIVHHMKNRGITHFTKDQMVAQDIRSRLWVSENKKEIREYGQFFVNGILKHEFSRRILQGGRENRGADRTPIEMPLKNWWED